VETKNPKILGITRYFGICGEKQAENQVLNGDCRGWVIPVYFGWFVIVIPLGDADSERDLELENCVGRKKKPLTEQRQICQPTPQRRKMCLS